MIDWGFTFSVVVVGLVVVFCVLVVLVFVCWLMGVAFKAIAKRKNDQLKTDSASTPAPKAVSTSAPAVSAKKTSAVKATASNGVTNEVVAAISAAVACVLGPDTKFALKSIRRVNSGDANQKGGRSARPAWNTAGITDNTRPF